MMLSGSQPHLLANGHQVVPNPNPNPKPAAPPNSHLLENATKYCLTKTLVLNQPHPPAAPPAERRQAVPYPYPNRKP